MTIISIDSLLGSQLNLLRFTTRLSSIGMASPNRLSFSNALPEPFPIVCRPEPRTVVIYDICRRNETWPGDIIDTVNNYEPKG